MMNNKWLFVLLISFFLPSMVFAGFALDQGVGIKGMQVGGAYTAAPQGSEAIYWNSARLGMMDDSQIYSTYSDQFGMGRVFTVLFNTKLSNNTGIGFAFFRDGIDDIDYTDSSGQSIGSGKITFTTDAYLVSLGQRFGDHGIGITVKMIQQSLGSVDKKQTVSADLACNLQLGQDLELGLVAQDALILSTDEDMYAVYRAGAAYSLADLVLSYDLAYYMLFEQYYSSVGAAYTVFDLLTLKGGYSAYYENTFLGASLSLTGMSVDYVFSNQEFGIFQKVGIGISF